MSNNLSFVQNLRRAARQHSPEILTGIGIAGMVGTVVLAVRATPKALLLIEEERKRLEHEDRDDSDQHPLITELSPIETIKVAWKPYIPAVITGTGAIFCIIGASKVNHKRNAALFTAYTLSETALRDYKDKVIETIGEKKEQQVRDNIAKDKLEKDPVSTKEVVITGKGNTLCYDAVFGRYFESDIEKIKKTVNELNRRLLIENYISMNELYYELGRPAVKGGEDLGWNVDTGLIELDFSTQLADDGRPCLVIDFKCELRYDFRTLY